MSIGIGMSLALKSNKGQRNPFAPLFALNRFAKIVILGDSIANGDTSPAGQTANPPWIRNAVIYSDGKLAGTVDSYGYGGLTATGHRIVGYKNDYLACNPDILIYHLGHNDDTTLTGGYAAVRAAILATIGEAIAAGAIVIVPELVPLAGKTADQYAGYTAHNAWLATLPGLYPGQVVFFAGFANAYDPTAGIYTADGVHPNKRGQDRLARLFISWILPLLSGIPKFSDQIITAGASGRLYNKGAPATLPFGGSMGGGYGGGYAESLNTSSGLSTGNSCIVAPNGDGSAVVAWVGAAASLANKWVAYSARVKAAQGFGVGNRSFIFGGYSDDQGQIVRWGPIDTLGAWGHAVFLRKCGGAAAQAIIQIFNGEVVDVDTTATGPTELAQVHIHEMSALGTALGVNYNLP
jgi:hypothetical protein